MNEQARAARLEIIRKAAEKHDLDVARSHIDYAFDEKDSEEGFSPSLTGVLENFKDLR